MRVNPAAAVLSLCIAMSATLTAALLAPGTATAAPRSGVGGSELDTRGIAVNVTPGIPAPPVPRASSYVIADLDTGQVLAARDPHGRYAPASCLKILTALTFIPRLNPNATMTATWGDAAEDGTKVGIVPDKRYRIRDLFTAMLIMSGNDAADAITTAYGRRGAALAAMNAEAAAVHADDTHAETPNGLDHAGQYSSAYDLALLTRAALQLPAFRQYVGTIRSKFGAVGGKHYEIYTHDHILLNYRGAFGVKNGYTVAAQASFVGAARRGGHQLVAVVMHANPYAWEDVMRMLTWGFEVDDVITPVGTLVEPDPSAFPTPTTPPSPAAVIAPGPANHTLAAGVPRGSKGSGIPTAPLVAAAAIVVAFVLLRFRARSRRRWRYRSRYSLPKL